MKQAELQDLLQSLHHNLNILREREAKFGANPPLELVNQIEDHQTAIGLVEAAIDGQLSPDELEAELAPLNLSLRGDTDIVAGHNIVKIGSLTIPALPLVVGVVVVLGLLAFGLWFYLVPIQMPLNTFNVAVAEFGQVDARGRVSASEDGKNLSEWMFGEMQAEYKNWPTNRPVVWNDSMSFLEKRSTIGRVQGDSPAERRQSAREIAERIGAQMVIYGNIAIDANPPHFIPEFYIADIENEADEIVGTHQLGAPIEVRLPLDLYDQRAGSFFEQQLGTRADALVWFTRGLALDLSGRHKDALAVFRNAESAEELQSWEAEQGREILYYFIGRQALFLSRDDSAYLAEAEAAFEVSLAINPDYVRTHIGLGGVYFQQAQQLSPEARLENDTLDLAIEEYTRAVEEGGDSPGQQIEIKGLLALGKSYRLRGEAFLFSGNIEQATSAYEKAIDDIEQAITLLDTGQHRLLAEAYLGLGIAYEGLAYAQSNREDGGRALFEKAVAAYDTCIEQAEIEFYDTTAQDVKNNYCAPYREDVQNVLADF